jgi:Txe/YoeB family toxin of toxin-antitoxin system
LFASPLALRAMDLVEAIMRDPFSGIGKPEPLKYMDSIWSRRLNQEHRIVYRVSHDRIDFLQARFHYHMTVHRFKSKPCIQIAMNRPL